MMVIFEEIVELRIAASSLGFCKATSSHQFGFLTMNCCKKKKINAGYNMAATLEAAQNDSRLSEELPNGSDRG